jgi:Tfp pilus assembly protein PilO
MTELKPEVKVALLVVAIVVALVAGWFVVVAPKRSEASSLKKEIADTRAQIDAAQGVRTPAQPAPIRVADLFRLSRAMPNTADIPGVILQLSHVANDTGVTFQSMTPHEPVQYGAYQQIAVDLAFQGRFYDLSDFLYRLRNLVSVHEGVLTATGRLFSVDSITFNQGEESFPQVKATLTVSAYVFGDGTTPVVPNGAAPNTTTTPTSPAIENTPPIPAAPAGATAVGA